MNRTKNIFLAARILMIAFMVIGAVFAVLVALKGTDKLEADASMLDPFFNITYVLLGATVLFAILFPIAGFITDYKKGIKAVLAVIAMAILFGISYVLASDSIEGPVYEKLEITKQVSKLVEGGIIMTYIMALISIVVVLFTSVSSMFKR